MHKNKILIFIFSFFLIFIALYSFRSDGKKINNDESQIQAQVIFLNVGQGDATLIQNKDLQILVDGGKSRVVLDELGKFMPFGDRKIEMLVLTHPDEDHMAGLLEVMKVYDIGEILETGVACDKDMCEKWNSMIQEKNISVNYAEFGESVKMAGVNLYVIYPIKVMQNEKIEELNDSSLVLKVENGSDSYLLMGDAGKAVEDILLSSNINLKADFLKVGHHGSKNSSSTSFLEAVSPKTAIISVGKNSYGHPAEEILNRLKNMNTAILRTDEIGSISF